MAKDTLKQLDQSIDGMFFTGAQVARTNPELLASRHKLAPIASKIPAIRRVTEQVTKLEQADGKAAASELLDLALLLAQVRTAQASPELPTEPTELVDLPPAVKIGSPMSPNELQAVVGALRNSDDARGKQRPHVIADAVNRGTARDLRILSLCVPALSDSGIADVVAQALIPAVGNAVSAELRRALDVEKGRGIDQRILRCLVQVDGAEALDILKDAVERGSADIRSTAIEEFGKVAPVEAEPIATMLVEKDRSKEVKLAAIRALAKAQGDEALDVLVRSFGGSADMRAAAEASLSQSTHPRATEKIIALFTPEYDELAHYKIKKATTKAEKDEAAKAQKAHNEKIGYLVDLVDLLASRGTEETKAIVVHIFRTHKIKEVRDTAARALLRMGYQEAWDELVPALYEAPEAAQYQFIYGAFTFNPTHAFERLAPFFKPEVLTTQAAMEFAQRALSRLGAIMMENTNEAMAAVVRSTSEWNDLCIQHLGTEGLQRPALILLKNTRPPNALEPALNLVRGPLPNAYLTLLIDLLAEYRDTRIPAAFIRLFNMLQGSYQQVHALEIFKTYDEPNLGSMLRYWLEERKAKRKMTKTEIEPIEQCIRHLQRDRNAPSTDN